MALPEQPGAAGGRTSLADLRLPLTVTVAALAATSGGALTKLLNDVTPFYFPVVSGMVVGYAVRRVGPDSRLLRAGIAGIFSFAGMVFGDALIFSLVDHPGVWNYLTHFWLAASTGKLILWALNVAVGAWFATGPPAPDLRGFPVHIDHNLCRHCGQGNLPDSKFCAHCGQPMP